MAKKLIKRRHKFDWGVLVIVIFLALALIGILRTSLSQGATLTEWSFMGGALALWTFILVRYLEWREYGGYEWKGRLRVCSWIALLAVLFFVFTSTLVGL
jgi:protein-S-isoprenylcysteine O-methyltransferase Ste14